MNEHDNHIDEALWNYIDGHTAENERTEVERLLQSNIEWKARYQELLEVHSMINRAVPLDEPSMRFTQNVMEEISRLYVTPAAVNYINRNVVRGIGLFFLTTIIALLVYGLMQTNWSAGIPDAWDLKRIDWSKFYNNTYANIFMMVNIVLALMLLDMQLSRRRRRGAGISA